MRFDDTNQLEISKQLARISKQNGIISNFRADYLRYLNKNQEEIECKSAKVSPLNRQHKEAWQTKNLLKVD